MGPTQTAVLQLARELGVATYPTSTAGKMRLKIPYLPTVLDFKSVATNSGSAATKKAVAALEAVAARVDVHSPMAHPQAPQLAAQSFWEWTCSQTSSKMARDDMRALTETSLAAHPEDISALHVAYAVKACGGYAAISDFEGGAQESRLEGGPDALVRKLAAELPEGSVRTLHAVARVEARGGASAWADEADGVAVHCANGAVVRASSAVLCLSPNMCEEIEFRPQLPEARRKLQAAWGPRRTPAVKVHLLLDKPVWRKKGHSGIGWDASTNVFFVDNTPKGADCGGSRRRVPPPRPRALCRAHGAAATQAYSSRLLTCRTRRTATTTAPPAGSRQ